MEYSQHYSKALQYSAAAFDAVRHLGPAIMKGEHLDRMPILADALEESEQHADDETLHHLRSMGTEGKIPVVTFVDNKIRVRPKPDKIHIHGKKWFQRTFGNTYHSAEIQVDDKPKIKLGRNYGYGNQYLWNALGHLKEQGYIPNNIAANPISVHQWLNGGLTYTEENVNRRKDL